MSGPAFLLGVRGRCPPPAEGTVPELAFVRHLQAEHAVRKFWKPQPCNFTRHKHWALVPGH